MKTVIRRYLSWGKFLTAVETEPAPCAPNGRTSRDESAGWTGSASIEAAVALAETGWRDKAKNLARRSAALMAQVGRHLQTVDPCYDIAGASIEMGRYNSGRPDCWIDWTPVVTDTPGNHIIRIVFNASVSGDMSLECIEARGAAVVALVEALELAGKRVELEVVRSGMAGGKRLVCGVVVKSPDQPYDADRLTFALCHPSMLRRLLFSVGESMTPDELKTLGWRSSDIGLTPDHSLDHIEADIRLTDNDMRSWDNPENAQAAILALLKQQGVAIK